MRKGAGEHKTKGHFQISTGMVVKGWEEAVHMPISVTYVTEEHLVFVGILRYICHRGSFVLCQRGSGILTNFWSPLLECVCLFVCFWLSNQGLLFFFLGDIYP